MKIVDTRRLIVVALATCVAIAFPSSWASAQSQIQQLVLGESVERELVTGDRHAYPVRLEAGQFLLTTVEQHGIDTYVSLLDTLGDVLAVGIGLCFPRCQVCRPEMPPSSGAAEAGDVWLATRTVGKGRFRSATGAGGGTWSADRHMRATQRPPQRRSPGTVTVESDRSGLGGRFPASRRSAWAPACCSCASQVLEYAVDRLGRGDERDDSHCRFATPGARKGIDFEYSALQFRPSVFCLA